MNFNKWSFTGRAEFFNRDIGEMDNVNVTKPIQVKGRSEAEALNRVKFIIRRNNKLPSNTRLALYDYTLEIISEDELLQITGQTKKCDICGTLLTDAGECPKCDLLDDRYDEDFILEQTEFSFSLDEIDDITADSQYCKPERKDTVTDKTFNAMEHSFYALSHMFKDLDIPGVEIKNFSNTGFTVNSNLTDFDNTLIKVYKYSTHSDWILADGYADSGYAGFVIVFNNNDLKRAEFVCPGRLVVLYIKIEDSTVEFICNGGATYKFDLNAVLEDYNIGVTMDYGTEQRAVAKYIGGK